jgi:threonine dehydrogenase-like Zn-dependent dehydrogenase
MKALVFHKPKNLEVMDVPEPKLKEPTDAIIKITRTAICGSDLHLYNGYIPTAEDGDILGHEFMGEVVEVGKSIKKLKVGDKIIVPFPISCGSCFFCKHELYSLCDVSNPNKKMAEGMYGFSPAALYGYSHLLGGIPGGQAEYVRVYYADANGFKVPKSITDNKLLFLTDIFPTGYMAAENAMSGVAIETVAVFGCGPVGLLTIDSLKFLGAKRIIAIDKVPERLQLAKKRGAEIVDFSVAKDIVEKLKEMTDRRGPDAVIDAVGLEAVGADILGTAYDKVKQTVRAQTDRPIVLREAIQACRKGGVVSIPGVYGGFVDKFPMGAAMNKGLTFKMGQTHVHKYVPKLLQLIEDGKIDPSYIITHEIPLSEAADAYQVFNEKKDNCIKIVLDPTR